MRNTMRNSIRGAMVLVASTLFVAPALAAEAKPAPAKPSTVIYQVTGLKWNGFQYVPQPGYALSTPNLKQAVDYAGQFCRFPGWAVTTNLPPAFGIPTIVDPSVGNARGVVSGAPFDNSLPPEFLNMLYAFGIQPSQLRPSIISTQTDGAASDPSFGAGDVSVSSDTSDIQNMINTQNMINNQQMLDTMQNTQNMIDTQNMVNSLQDMVNTQNAVNEQNMINAMSNP